MAFNIILFRRRRLKRKILRELNNTKEAVYPSDFSEKYNLPYEEVKEIFEELALEGKARRV